MKKLILITIVLVILTVPRLILCKNENNFLFYEKFKEINEFTGKKYELNIKTLTTKDYVNVIKESKKLTCWELVTKNNEIIPYSYDTIIFYFPIDLEATEIDYEFEYYDLTKDFGKDFEYYNFGMTKQSAFDDENTYGVLINNRKNKIIFFKNENNYKQVIKEFEINKNINLNNFKFMGGFSNKNKPIVFFTDENNILYGVDINTLKIIYKKDLETAEVQMIYDREEEDTDVPRIGYNPEFGKFIVLLDRVKNEISVIKWPIETLYEKIVISSVIEGEIKKVIWGQGVYILTNMIDKSQRIYEISNFDNKIRYIEREKIESKKFNGIIDMYSYDGNKSFQKNGVYLVILNSKVNNQPVNEIYPNGNWNQVILDISTWSHPTKNIFNKYEIKINKVELIENYPIFYVNLEKKFSKNELDKIISELLKANGYWDFEIKDSSSNKTIKVYGDKKNKKLIKWEYN